MKTDDIKIKPDWSKSKEDIWSDKFAGLEDETPAPIIKLSSRRIWQYAAAAVVAIALLVPSVSYIYTDSVTAPKGEHLAVTLPDGSTVQLNADSRISYKPLWWKISREVKLDGEAYFEVAKGRTFAVVSGDVTVQVLGTSFNVFARGERYNVTCLTGRVSVSKLSQSVVLTPGMQAVFTDRKLTAIETAYIQDAVSWTENRFVFSGVPLPDVVAEIERQYNIEVLATGMKPDYLYSGNFSKTDDPVQVLQIVGRPFGVEFKIK